MNDENRAILREIAHQSILHGLHSKKPLDLNLSSFPPELVADGAAFVTLTLHGHLRGCIGDLEAYRPLVRSVADNAFNAAFRDARFDPLREEEFPQIELHLCVLTVPEPITFTSEEDLLRQLRPGQDGLVLKLGHRRGTFLPVVWHSLPKPCDFLRELKIKTGLKPSFWSPEIQVSRYEAEEF